MAGIEPTESGLQEWLFPLNDGRSAGLKLTFDGVEGSTHAQHEDHLDAKRVSGCRGARMGNAAEFQPLVWGEEEFGACGRASLEP
jgi:hypothetical protein